jgi:hypothetical protein
MSNPEDILASADRHIRVFVSSTFGNIIHDHAIRFMDRFV